MQAKQPERTFRFAVRLTPKGGRDAIDGWRTNANGKKMLAARVSAAPEDGKANEALVKLIARTLHVGKSKVRIVTGATSRLKIVEVEGGEDLASLLAPKETA